MNRTALERYERTTDGRIIIDVAAARVEDLYNDFDKNAPYIRRDLDQDLVDYLIGCAKELKRVPFVIRFSLEQAWDEQKDSRIRRSINAYFLYLVEVERQNVMQMFRRSGVLAAIGVGILFVSVSVNRALGADRSVVANVFAEGLTVAAWVSLWEAVAVFLLQWFPQRKRIKLYERLANAELHFRSVDSAR